MKNNCPHLQKLQLFPVSCFLFFYISFLEISASILFENKNCNTCFKQTPKKQSQKKRHYRLFIFDDYIYNKKSDGLNMRRTPLSGPKFT